MRKNMNQLPKLKHFRYIVKKLYFKYSIQQYDFNFCTHYKIGTQPIQMIDLNHVSSLNSCNQIREYAKRAQGKAPKGGKAKKMQLTDEEMADVIDIEDYHLQLNAVADRLKKDYVENLSIRSAVGNIENIIVKVNGEDYPLNELAVISKKNPNLIAINMSDFPEGLKPAMQAIVESGSGFNPQQDGTMLYVAVPKMTREHREHLAKNAKTLYMKAKDEIRSIQNSFIKDAKNKTELSDDLVFNTANQIKGMADQFSLDLEKIMKIKQKELLGDS